MGWKSPNKSGAGSETFPLRGPVDPWTTAVIGFVVQTSISDGARLWLLAILASFEIMSKESLLAMEG